MAEQLAVRQTPEVNQELRIRTDTSTWLAETLHGSMRTNFEFNFDGQELRGEDGGSLDDIFDEAILEAKMITEENPSMLFELRRRLIERDELGDMYKMVRGELPNTMVVVSDFPEELKTETEDVGGYNVTRQQTMMRIISLQPDGNLKITSQSLDGSNRQALEAIYAAMGQESQPGELLEQRIHRDLPQEWQENLADNLTKTYDNSLAEQKGGEWHAGISQRPDRNIANTYDFVLVQRDLIDWFVGEKLANPARAENLRFRLAATANARHERFLKAQQHTSVPGLVRYESFITPQSLMYHQGLQQELIREERRAAREGKSFSGCGGTVKSGESSDESSTLDQLGQLGFGNNSQNEKRGRSGGGRDKYGSLTFECPKGHKNTRERNKLIDKCKTCGTSVKC